MHPKIKAIIKKGLIKYGYKIQTVSPVDTPNPIHLWNDDHKFKKLMDQILGYTVVDEVRCFMIYQYAKQAAQLPGDVAEVGVYQGGTAKLVAKVFTRKKNKVVHLFDTFSGTPKGDSKKDLHKESDFSDTSLRSVKKYLKDCKNVQFYPGIFPETADPISRKKFCFVHIDVDLYKSVIDCCTFFYPQMESGGIMIFDDYGFITCPGAKIAVDEFFKDKPDSPTYLPTGQSIVTRL